LDSTLIYLTEFYKKNNCPRPSELLINQPDTFYFAKDRLGRFVCADKILLKHFQMELGEEILGKSDFDILRKDLAEKYRIDDLAIIQSEQTIANKLELVGDGKVNVRWFLTTKGPLRNNAGEVIGIEGFSRDVKLTKQSIEPYSEFKSTIDYIQSHFAGSIAIPNLARESGMSISTFERKFKSHFGSSPNQFIKKLRVDRACERLSNGVDISSVALECGFCDQSYFTKEFKSVMSVTPRQFQKSNCDF